MITYSSFSKLRTLLLDMPRKARWRSKREGVPPHSMWCQPTHRPLCWNPSWLRGAHTWEHPGINQIWTQQQAKQDDWPNEIQEETLIKVIQATSRPQISCLYVHPHILFFLLIKTCFTTFCFYVEIPFTQLLGKGLVTGCCPWWSSG